MLVSTGGASGKPYHAFKHNACCDPRARAAMEEARRALEEPGLEPGDVAWSEHERMRQQESAAKSLQGCLPLGDA